MIVEKFQETLLKGAVLAMGCDGDIAPSEEELINQMLEEEVFFLGFKYQDLLKEFTQDLKQRGKEAINDFISSLGTSKFKEAQELIMIDVLLRVINADDLIEDSEVKFLQMVKSQLTVSEEELITKFPKNINQLIDFNNYGLHKEFIEDIEFEKD